MNGAGGERQRNSLPDDGLQIGTPYSPARRPEVKEEGGSAPVQEYQGEEEGDRLSQNGGGRCAGHPPPQITGKEQVQDQIDGRGNGNKQEGVL